MAMCSSSYLASSLPKIVTPRFGCTIATGNMTPSFAVTEDGAVRPTFLYCVDAAEFAVNKLTDRGSLSSVGIVTNVQDFITIIARGLGVMD